MLQHIVIACKSLKRHASVKRHLDECIQLVQKELEGVFVFDHEGRLRKETILCELRLERAKYAEKLYKEMQQQ